MSVPYEKELLATDTLKLVINTGGIDKDDKTNQSDFSLSIFAFNKAKIAHIFSEQLDFTQAKSLYDYLDSFSILKKGGPIESGKFVEVTADSSSILAAISTVDSELVKKLLAKADNNNKLEVIVGALSTIELQNLHASIRQSAHKQSLKDLNQLLELEKNGDIVKTISALNHLSAYIAKQPEKIFQNWIEANIWTLGIDYIQKHSARDISIDSISDLMMESTDGYIDLIELKRPCMTLLSFDASHKSHYPSPDLSKTLGQCWHYLKQLDDYKLILEKRHKYKLLRPRIKIIAGRSDTFSDEQHDALRMINSGLTSVQVISYDYLHACGENIVSYYDQQVTEAVESGNDEPLPAMS
ncbi:Shedu anti-phage system protein SduA domain-containing protein [Hymenobacter convexus]|uniref:Shedu anti-phage system protein SduA domain-containing protein n=1 Tax=Hymenobacter sp. CA1UV-4 TaxID=3063782 RepID=UPI002712B4CB|nr:Shedu anti-phage system protein SduA domain-containing protein [Hymenobacter sp. CA1UV-4]MDO7852092.1 DUF4263 domain-containing protein [Hymenobacter sp. CA1UV-4]